MFNQFGKKIKELRDANLLKQNQVASELGIDTPLLCKIEKGQRIAKREFISRFAMIFSESENELLTIWLADKMLKITKDEKKAFEAVCFVKNLLQINNKIIIK